MYVFIDIAFKFHEHGNTWFDISIANATLNKYDLDENLNFKYSYY